MKRIAVASFIVLSMLALAVSAPIIEIWDGGYDLKIDVSSVGDRPKWVWFGRQRDRESAAFLLKEMLQAERKFFDDENGNSTIVDPFSEELVTLNIPLSGRKSLLFGELRETQHGRFLVVIAEMPNGERRGKIVHIPDHKQSRKVAVSIP